MKDLTQTRLHELFGLNTETGELIWRVSKGSKKQGNIAGSINKKGYRCIKIDGRNYKAHRLVWLYTFGSWPKDQLDHIDGNRSNNRLDNLRECTHGENQQNLAPKTGGTSNYPGIYWAKHVQKWQVSIRIKGKSEYLGLFTNELEAAEAYKLAKQLYHTFNPVQRAA
ncbi:MAG: HNH endonuclease signature motif containing protein [Saprospiraceae bacterium]|nr:HNH endonuclease signature motif containing protein [Saprospiraceae bacterium]